MAKLVETAVVINQVSKNGKTKRCGVVGMSNSPGNITYHRLSDAQVKTLMGLPASRTGLEKRLALLNKPGRSTRRRRKNKGTTRRRKKKRGKSAKGGRKTRRR